MANYGYCYLKTPTTPEELEARIRSAVTSCLGERWAVKRADWEHLVNESTWWIHIPGTATDDNQEAMKLWTAPGEDVGFPVAIEQDSEGRTIAFRHGVGPFAGWAQGCVEEALADAYGVGITYDATGETRPPGTRERRSHPNYFEYAVRKFEKPLSKEDLAYIHMRVRWYVPKGFWDGPEAPQDP